MSKQLVTIYTVSRKAKTAPARNAVGSRVEVIDA